MSWFLDLNEKGQLDLNPPYQRRSVWSPRDKRFFIDTILNNYPAPPVFLHKSLDDNGRPTYHVVDGKQRLETIIDFTNDKIRIPDEFVDATLRKKKWSELARPSREAFWNYTIIVEMIPDISEAFIKNAFERINRNSRKLTQQELRHAKYDGWFISAAEAEAEKAEWKEFGVVTTARAKRMADVQFISELLAVVLRSRLSGFDQDDLDTLYAEYEDPSEVALFVEDDFLEKVGSIKYKLSSFIEICPEIRDSMKVQAHLYSLWSYLHLHGTGDLSDQDFVEKYRRFLDDVVGSIAQDLPAIDEQAEDAPYRMAVRNYASNSRGASTDLTPRLRRHESLIHAIHGLEAAAHENS